jgi:predicted secreted Zn-dependent protease
MLIPERLAVLLALGLTLPVNITTALTLWVQRLGALTVLGFALEALAQNSLMITTNFYHVSGATEQELRDSIHQSRPWKDRSEGDAHTEWKIEWSFNLASSEQEFQVQSFATKTTINVTLPKRIPNPQAPGPLDQKWARYINALKAHEEGHKQIALSAAAEIRKRVGALGAEPTREAVVTSINTAANQTIAQYRQKEAEYDRKTAHGVTEGARFP